MCYIGSLKIIKEYKNLKIIFRYQKIVFEDFGLDHGYGRRNAVYAQRDHYSEEKGKRRATLRTLSGKRNIHTKSIGRRNLPGDRAISDDQGPV